jgi:hypothetical protein
LLLWDESPAFLDPHIDHLEENSFVSVREFLQLLDRTSDPFSKMARKTAKMGGEFKSRRGMNEELRCRNSQPLRVRVKGMATLD